MKFWLALAEALLMGATVAAAVALVVVIVLDASTPGGYFTW